VAGGGGCRAAAPLTQAKAKFFGQKPATEIEKIHIFVFIKRKNGIHSI